MSPKSMFTRQAFSLHDAILQCVCLAVILTAFLPLSSPIQAAPQQQVAPSPLVNCVPTNEFVLVCNLHADDVGTARASATPQAVQPGGTTVLLGSANWLSVRSLFLHDTNGNSHTVYEYGPSSTGPWTQVCNEGVPGEADWRYCSFGGLTAGATYYLRQTYVDPDGVTGLNPVVLGPIPMPATVNNGVTLQSITPLVKDTHILVTINVYGDANMNSSATVDVATSNSGPWTRKCGAQSSFAPKLCRIHGLTPNTNYYLQVTLSDPDGVTGSTPQVIGPLVYTGVANLALNRSITADPGWGCCSNPAELVNGRIQNDSWAYGFAWNGGNSGYGGAPGWKQATIDLGATKSINRVDWWTHDANNVPTTWKVAVSSNGITFTDVYSSVTPQCRTATGGLDTYWGRPNCSHSARFNAISTRYVRYSFDDTTLIGGIHGWAVELEVFKQKNAIIRLRKYQDTNSDGSHDDGEPWLTGWDFKLYRSNGVLVSTQTTNALGKASFTNLAPARYTLCEEQKAGWYSTQPGIHDATYDQPCYTVTVTWNALASVMFGNSTTPPVVSAQRDSSEDGVVITFLSDTQPDPADLIEEYDPWLDQPDAVATIYLPLVRE